MTTSAAITPGTAPSAADASGLAGLRSSLLWLARWLVLYGIAGLLSAIIGVGALAWAGGRIESLDGNAEATAAHLTSTINLAALALRDAARSAQSFGTTVDQSAQAVSSAATTMTEVRADLVAFESQLRVVSIFGLAPLASPADAIGRVGTSLNGLDTRLSLAADGLAGSETALKANAASLLELADSTDALAARLATALGPDAFAELRMVVLVALVVWAAWALIPAVGALVLGLWLNGVVRRTWIIPGQGPAHAG